MDIRNFLQKYKYDFFKIFGVAIVVFLGLTWRIHSVGEMETESMIQIDYLDETNTEHSANSEVEDILAQILSILDEEAPEDSVIQQPSPTSSSKSFETLCESDTELCKKSQFNGDFSDKEHYSYFKQFQFLVDELDSSSKRGSDIRTTIQNFIVNSIKGSRRGSAGWYKLTLNLGGMKYDNEYFQVLTHEMGHIVDLGSLQGKSKTKHANFTEFDKVVFAIDDPSLEYYKYSRQSEKIRKSGVKKQDFCSGYGMSDPFEDFAECHNLFLNHQDIFRSLAKNNDSLKDKYNYLANLYGGNYLSNSTRSASSLSSDRRAWDTTRIEE